MFCSLVSCRNRSWDPPFRAFPSRKSRPLSRPPAPLQLSTNVPECSPWAVSPLVSPTPTLSRSRLDPPTAKDSLSVSRSPRPGRPGHQAEEPLVSASFAYFEALILPRIRSLVPRVSPRHRPILSWVFPSLKPSPTAPRVLHPPKPQGPKRWPSSEGSGSRPKGISAPSSRVRLSWHQKHQDKLVDGCRPHYRNSPNRLSAITLPPLALVFQGKP